MLASGSMFAGYRVERVLGAGGMGTVYLGRSPELPRYDAVKVLPPELSRDPNFRARFIREADVASGLSHPNIVSIYSRGEFEGQLWIAMQYVDGSDADTALRAGTMDPARALHIVAEVAKALDYAHYHQVVHRDVKPANFLLSTEGGGPERVFLGDFGIARAFDDVGLTMTGAVMATVAYAAPEVLAGASFDGRADLYSLGCTLFRMLTGKTPFSGANGLAAVMMAHLQQPPPRVTGWMPELPAGLDHVVARAMAKDPAQRFGSARELADAAAEALNERTTLIGTWRPVSASQVNSYQDSPAAGVQWWQQASGQRTIVAPPTRPRRRRSRLIAATAGVVAIAAGSVVAATVIGRSDSPASAPPTSSEPEPAGLVPISQLAGLLTPLDQVGSIMGGVPLEVAIGGPAPLDDSAALTEKDCLSAWMPAQADAYAASGFQGLQLQVLGDLTQPAPLNPVVQAVAAFPSTASARTFVDNQKVQWGKCAGRTITVNLPNREPMQFDLKAPGLMPGGIVMLTQSPRETGQLLPCFRTLALRNNVVVDVRACTIKVANAALLLASTIADRVPQ